MNPVVRGDIRVSEFLDSVGGFRHKDRRDTLLNILDVDVDWRMHQISDGERRRVQLVMGLMVPWTLLLLDEVDFCYNLPNSLSNTITGHCRPRCRRQNGPDKFPHCGIQGEKRDYTV